MNQEIEQRASAPRWTWRRIVKVLLTVAGTAIMLFVALVVIGLMVRNEPPEAETRPETPAGDSVAQARQVDDPTTDPGVLDAMRQAVEEMSKPVAQAWKFLAVQRHMLRLVTVNYPELEDRVVEAQAKFNDSFGKAVPAIESRIGRATKDLLRDFEGTRTLSKEEAVDYLERLEDRARGEIAAPVLKTLLAYQYREAPHEELVDGFTQVYSTEGEPKAKGLVIEVTVPRSWEHVPDRRSKMVRRFTSQHDQAVAVMFVGISDQVADHERRTGKALTAPEIATVESRTGNDAMLDNIFASANSPYDMEGNREVPESIRVESVQIDGIPALERTSVATRSAAGRTFITYVHGYTFVHNRYLVMAEASVLRDAEESEEEFRAKQERWRPLFQRIAANIVIRSPRD